MKSLHPLAALSVAALLLAPVCTRAAGDHDHDHGPATTSASPALPRFAAESELFELVGVLKGPQITLYLDRAVDNSPVTDAQIELGIAGKKYMAKKLGADEFEVRLPAPPPPGVLAITATVTADKETDLLAGELDIQAAAPGAAHSHVHSWREYAGWAAGGVAALALLTGLSMAWLRRRQSPRAPRIGSAA